jgi:hypothetical protein
MYSVYIGNVTVIHINPPNDANISVNVFMIVSVLNCYIIITEFLLIMC